MSIITTTVQYDSWNTQNSRIVRQKRNGRDIYRKVKLTLFAGNRVLYIEDQRIPPKNFWANQFQQCSSPHMFWLTIDKLLLSFLPLLLSSQSSSTWWHCKTFLSIHKNSIFHILPIGLFQQKTRKQSESLTLDSEVKAFQL